MLKHIIFLITTIATFPVKSANSETPSRPYLTLEAAIVGVQSCLKYAKDNDLRVAISVKDRGGETILFMRMNDVYTKQMELAETKALTAAGTPVSTARMSDITKSGSAVEGLIQLPGITRVEGGEPIRLESGYHIGGIGVSGAKPKQDGDCARIAATKLNNAL